MPRKPARPTAFSAALRAARKRRGQSIRVVADLMGLAPPSLQAYEYGYTLPEPGTVVQIAEQLSVNPAPLLRLWVRAKVGDDLAGLVFEDAPARATLAVRTREPLETIRQAVVHLESLVGE